MPRLVYLLGVGLLLGGGALALTHELLGPWRGVNVCDVRRMKPGMTMPEVEAVLGGPPTKRTDIVWGRGWSPKDRSAFLRWSGQSGVVWVVMNAGRVRQADWFLAEPRSGPLSCLR